MDFSVVLPAYNEAENFPSLLRDIKANLNGLGISYEIILVDNGSSDNTSEVANALKTEIPQLKAIRVWPNIGFGNGVLQGLNAANGEIMGFIDADGQIEAKYLTEAYLKLKKENLSLCKGKRITRHDGWQRRLASFIYNRLFKLMFGGDISDLGAKPKLFTRKLYEAIKPVSRDWFIDTEIMIKIIKRGERAGEVPIVFQQRQQGKSKVRISTALEFVKNMFYWRFFKHY